MYKQSHYHSTTHECLGIISGAATLRFGVSDEEDTSAGKELSVQPGDMLVIPAGVAHRAVEHTPDFLMVGSYPNGAKQWDMCYSKTPVEPGIGLPADPLGGSDLARHWA